MTRHVHRPLDVVRQSAAIGLRPSEWLDIVASVVGVESLSSAEDREAMLSRVAQP